jgi:hypothetical protein
MTTLKAGQFKAGECWRYRAPEGCEGSRILIGAVLSFADGEPIVCCAVTDAQRLLPDGRLDTVTIPFLPLTEAALAASVTTCEGDAHLPADFGEAFEIWHGDPRGLTSFSVPFEGRLDLMIARQMMDIVGPA